MLKVLNPSQTRFIALLAKAARAQGDALIGKIAEEDFGEPKPSRGNQDLRANLDLEDLPVDATQNDLLKEAVNRLPGAALQELYALMRIGQGHLAVKTFERGLSEAASIDMAELAQTIVENPDLHDHLAKALYECRLDG